MYESFFGMVRNNVEFALVPAVVSRSNQNVSANEKLLELVPLRDEFLQKVLGHVNRLFVSDEFRRIANPKP